MNGEDKVLMSLRANVVALCIYFSSSKPICLAEGKFVSISYNMFSVHYTNIAVWKQAFILFLTVTCSLSLT